MQNELVTIVCGIIILACIIAAIVIRLKRNPVAGKEQAMEFLEGLSDVFYDKMIEIINNFDFKSYSSLPELESAILSNIYDAIWEYVEKELSDSSKTDILTAIALKVLNKDFVDSFVNTLLDRYNVSVLIGQKYSEAFNVEDKMQESVVEDANIQKEFSSNDYVEDSSNLELEPAKEVEPTAEELSKLNPPSEEEPNYDPENDDGVEILENSEE